MIPFLFSKAALTEPSQEANPADKPASEAAVPAVMVVAVVAGASIPRVCCPGMAGVITETLP